MIIKKIRHCCFTIKINNTIFITDPGSFTKLDEMMWVDVLLLSHEHGDHYNVDNIQKLIKLNSDLKIYTNEAVHELLKDEGIDSETMADGDISEYEGIPIKAIGEWHEEIWEERGKVQNIGFYINEKVFFTGDAFQELHIAPEVLLFCIAGPFIRLKESISYAKNISPRVAIAMHESILIEDLQEFSFSIIDYAFNIHETMFIPLMPGGEYTHVG
jgi:L-ascorbate metabolism protein UlaG (beta-lactamase superfamily)